MRAAERMSKAEPSTPPPKYEYRKKVSWQPDTVDNELLQKKKFDNEFAEKRLALTEVIDSDDEDEEVGPSKKPADDGATSSASTSKT